MSAHQRILVFVCAVVLVAGLVAGPATASTSEPAEPFDVAFSSATHACMLAATFSGEGHEDPVVTISTDGGRHWKPAGSWPSSLAPRSLVFFDGGHGCAVGAGGVISLTSDGGNHWGPAVSMSTTPGPLSDVAFGTVANGVAVGSYDTFTDEGATDTHPIVLVTNNGGAAWHAAASLGDEDLGYVYGVTMAGTHACALAESGHQTLVNGVLVFERMILLSDDGGEHWSRVASIGTDAPLVGIALLKFPNRTGGPYGAAVGQAGTVVYTIDNGQHWAASTSTGTTKNLKAVTFSDELHACAVGDGGTIIRSGDSGHTWKVVGKNVTTSDLDHVSFADKSVGCAIGPSGVILRTTDGGKTWHNVGTSVRPVATSITKPTVTPGVPRPGLQLTFWATITPAGAATAATAKVHLSHLEVKAVQGKLRKTWVNKGAIKMSGGASGQLSAPTRLRSTGSWRVWVTYKGAARYLASTSPVRRFEVR